MIFVGADWHLDRYIWKSRKDLDGDSYRALDEVARVIAEYPAKNKAILLAGDVCNTRKIDGLTLRALTGFIEKCHTCDCSVYFILGNHDKGEILSMEDEQEVSEIVSALAVQGGIHLHRKAFRIDDRVVTGLDWLPREELHTEITAVPKCDILLLHAKMEHLCGYKMAADLALTDIPGYVQHLVVGDIHTVDKTDMINSSGTCISPGALHPCDITQGGEHGIWGLEEGSDTWEFIPVPTRQIYRHQLPDTEDPEVLEHFVKKIEDDLGKDELLPLVEIAYSTVHTALVDRILERCSGKAHFFTKPGTSGKIISQGDLSDMKLSLDELTLEGSLRDVVDPGKEPEVYNFLHTMLTSQAPLELLLSKMEGVLDATN